LPRRFPRPTQAPYRALFFDPRTARDIDAMRDAEEAAVRDERALAVYRAGRSCHPLQPFLEWSACDAAAHRLGAVLIAGCRDAQTARQLGLIPVHGLGAALDMARRRGAGRIGYLVAPPYFPVTVGA
jgi:predicted N-acetyltransferase YhbS